MLTALVTGSEQRLGRGFVGELVTRGFRVFAGSHALTKQKRGPREVSQAITELPLDVTDPVLVQASAEAVDEELEGPVLLAGSATRIVGMALDSKRQRSDESGFAVYDGMTHRW